MEPSKAEAKAVKRVDEMSDAIETAVGEIERALVDVESADGWIAVLSTVEESSRRGYKLRRRMLGEAITANDRRRENDRSQEADSEEASGEEEGSA